MVVCVELADFLRVFSFTELCQLQVCCKFYIKRVIFMLRRADREEMAENRLATLRVLQNSYKTGLGELRIWAHFSFPVAFNFFHKFSQSK